VRDKFRPRTGQPRETLGFILWEERVKSWTESMRQAKKTLWGDATKDVNEDRFWTYFGKAPRRSCTKVKEYPLVLLQKKWDKYKLP